MTEHENPYDNDGLLIIGKPGPNMISRQVRVILKPGQTEIPEPPCQIQKIGIGEDGIDLVEITPLN